MRLLNSESREMVQFNGTDIPPYAILSHTWGQDEATLHDMQSPDVESKAGFSKILSCCNQAKLDGIEWVWIDTCCIDKTSSVELSEAINSMYAWYHDSEVCYAYLEDVTAQAPFSPGDKFKGARWFTRGWCLQELIAPRKIEFYAADWTEIGTKQSLHSRIERITGIPAACLLGSSKMAGYTSAQKMSWASSRETTREEDQAYCLLGIFGVSMPLLYGEGRRAFHRLQVEIMNQTEDYSLLLWTEKIPSTWDILGALASSPSYFPKAGPCVSPGRHCNYRSIKSTLHPGADSEDPSLHDMDLKPQQMTTRGLYLHTFVREVWPTEQAHIPASLLLWTGCKYGKDYMCILLQLDTRSVFSRYGRRIGTTDRIVLIDSKNFESFEPYELYLNTDMRPSSGIMHASERPDLEIILATKCEENASFFEAFPSIMIYKSGDCAQGHRLYCLNMMWDKERSLKFKSVQRSSGITTGHFTVNLGGERAYSWCSLVVDSYANSLPLGDAGAQSHIYEQHDSGIHDSQNECERGILSPKHAGIEILTHNSETDSDDIDSDKVEVNNFEIEENEIRFSDRAAGQLPNGTRIYVAIKHTDNPGSLGYLQDWRQRKPACYTLYITLLARMAGETSVSSA